MIELSLCTISFRHHLIALPDIAQWALENGFQAIELWGVHALHLSDQPHFNAQWIAEQSLNVSMLSDYLPMEGDERIAIHKMRMLCRLANHWGALKVRTFAGRRSSAEMNLLEFQVLAKRMRRLSAIAEEHGVSLVVETHPGTYADCARKTLDLMEEIHHPACGVNFDVLHLWEAGDDPSVVWHTLLPYIRHVHLKNIRRREQLDIFAPQNVYSPAGSREGMVPLFQGAYDYRQFLLNLPKSSSFFASLEWFGGFNKQVLKNDCLEVIKMFTQRKSA